MMIRRWKEDKQIWQGSPVEDRVSLGRSEMLVIPRAARCGLLASGTDITVNGFPAMPLCILTDKDELRVDGEVVYFSVESAWTAVPFKEPNQIFCARCKGAIKRDGMSVQCRCGAWFHQSDAIQCWTYDVRCSSCDQPTTGISWLPEPLARKKKRQRIGHE
jgi:hypothetical protein